MGKQSEAIAPSISPSSRLKAPLRRVKAPLSAVKAPLSAVRAPFDDPVPYGRDAEGSQNDELP